MASKLTVDLTVPSLRSKIGIIVHDSSLGIIARVWQPAAFG